MVTVLMVPEAAGLTAIVNADHSMLLFSVNAPGSTVVAVDSVVQAA
jgi:hypothetical protein